MSELKSFIVLYDGKFIRAYDESEADKVIARSKEKLVEQTTLRVWAELQLRHNKYKRCIAMVRMLEYMFCPVTDCKENWRVKWHKRWLELAERFKPNKER